MALGDLKLQKKYRRKLHNQMVLDFFQPCLGEADRYDRASGYFSSAVLEVAKSAFIRFFEAGGRVRIICSPYLSYEDCCAIKEMPEKSIGIKSTENFKYLLKLEASASSASLFAFLLASGRIEMKLATMKSGDLFHEKFGIFYDSEHRVSFQGSANESFKGWAEQGNREGIVIFRSWLAHEGVDVDDDVNEFQSLWDNRDGEVLCHEPSEDLMRCVSEEEKAGKEIYEGLSRSASERAGQSVPKRKTPEPHQDAVLENWRENDFRGIISFCTGAGKTVAGLWAINEIFDKGMGALVLVPSKLLLGQWEKELRDFFPGISITLAGAGNSGWKTNDAIERTLNQYDGRIVPRVVLAITASARKEEFLSRIRGKDWLLLVDEVHHIGASKYRKILTHLPDFRLALSATPTRYGDPDGTKLIFDSFRPLLEPLVGIPDAIYKFKRLVPYQYQIEFVGLTAEEQDSWDDKTTKIRKLYAQTIEASVESNVVKRYQLLLIERSRIAKKAAQKVSKCIEIVKNNFEEGQSWLLYLEDNEEITKVRSALKEAGIEAILYSSSQSDKEQSSVLNWFHAQGGILLSMKCLDEGVDIPKISHCILISSSQNPRTFIQRRGRVLRKSGREKHRAFIWDILVKPSVEDLENTESLIRAEAVRSLEFAKYAENKDCGYILQSELASLGINIEEIIAEGEEEEYLE
jgi:superfamily II DNA or RNA helicase